MDRISISRAAGILVVALLCGTEVRLATGITNTDGPTTTPISTTTGPTSTPTPTTTGPTTTTKPTTTKPTTTMTTAAATTVNSTTETTIATTSNMTTAISNMTTTISNMTTVLSNMTTIISNMTTTTSMTTPSGGTTSAPKAQWQVKDEDGKLCILMNFSGTITLVTRSYTMKIPSDAHVSGNCSSPSHSAFFLYFSEGSGLSIQYWRFGLTFVIRGSSFELQKVEASWSTFSSALSSSSSGKFFDVPVGSYYNCTEFNVRLSLFQLNLTKPSFQPFVKKTKGGDMGDAYQCRPPSADSADLALIIGIAVGVVVVIIAAIVVTVYLVKKGKSPSARGYSKEP
ncbi:A-agglutinin anchorage subunit-like [Lytechinus variegatus]|uniref:A-agglutinin anchorage subunit-like n=1 Tax=Lytechinus variegatus TaxID=7654 RepID=UPI001BB0DB42|nr:A-agglutinin anchorage subunit-like [Lytechinus variegatus]